VGAIPTLFFAGKCKACLTYRNGYAILLDVKQTLQKEAAMKNRIEEIRKERGIRQEELAKVLGVSRQTISSLETGRYNPSIFLAYKVARYFDMTIEDVFLFDEEAEIGGTVK
jgi:putative transcriptional regulator